MAGSLPQGEALLLARLGRSFGRFGWAARRLAIVIWFIVGMDRGGTLGFGKSACLLQGSMQGEFDLAVEAPELIVGPSPKCFEHFGLDSEQKTVAFGHRLIDPIPEAS